MRKHVLAVVTVAIATIVLAGMLLVPASADAKRFRAFVYPDRANPSMSVTIDDFRVNETVWDEGGVQYIWVHGPAGSFQMFFKDIQQIEVTKYLGLTLVDWVKYEVKVTGSDQRVITGTLDLRVMRGLATGVPWYSYPATQRDKGSQMWRVVIADDRLPPTIPWEEPRKEPEPEPVAMVMPPPPPPAPEPEDPFGGLSLDELNAKGLLKDVFFDFDMSLLRPDGERALEQNLAFLKEYPSVVVRVEGYADPRGTNEYNLELGERRASRAAEYLLQHGIAAERLQIVSKGKSQQVCIDATEACWSQNRRTHLTIIAK